MTLTARAEGAVRAAPDEVFTVLTDVARLPDWNARMTAVVEPPTRLEPGAEWVVAFRVLGQSWRSRSRVESIDPLGHRFVHTSRTDDGNPSHALWEWTVDPDPAGSRVRVSWSLHPATFWRRTLLVRMRARQLARTELPASLAALSTIVTSHHSNDEDAPK